jgi:hypothetical protein
MISRNLFTEIQRIKNFNLNIHAEARRFWQELITHKFTIEEADRRMVLYLAKFLEREITYSFMDTIGNVDDLPEYGNPETDYTLVKYLDQSEHARHSIHDVFFIFDRNDSKWSSDPMRLY